MKLYLVGGAVRERLFNAFSSAKDFDFAVEAPSFEEMRVGLIQQYGLHIWQERPEFVTLRGNIRIADFCGFAGPLPDPLRIIDADFTLCRKETMYSDKRHPDTVTPTDIFTDLSRRDFTINAIAVPQLHGPWIDPYDGMGDAEQRILRTVGDPRERFEEDPLRMLRAVRFAVRHRLHFSDSLRYALDDRQIVEGLRTLPHERVREELNRALQHDWRATMILLIHECPSLGMVLSRSFPNLWLRATTEER